MRAGGLHSGRLVGLFMFLSVCPVSWCAGAASRCEGLATKLHFEALLDQGQLGCLGCCAANPKAGLCWSCEDVLEAAC